MTDREAQDLFSKETLSGLWETARTVIYAIFIALFIRTLAWEPFNIPSGSMKPTLLVGDYLFVSKFAYGYSKFSLPFGLPLFSGRIFESAPVRGDVAVFRKPTDTETDYIKRIIGLPGDRIQVRHSILYINDVEVVREPAGEFVETGWNGNSTRLRQYIETLPNGRRYTVLDRRPDGSLDNTPVYEVPEGHYFAMGDNRDNSSDSRVLSEVGYIPAENLVGRADIIFFSTDGSAGFVEVWNWFGAMRFGRMFQGIE